MPAKAGCCEPEHARQPEYCRYFPANVFAIDSMPFSFYLYVFELPQFSLMLVCSLSVFHSASSPKCTCDVLQLTILSHIFKSCSILSCASQDRETLWQDKKNRWIIGAQIKEEAVPAHLLNSSTKEMSHDWDGEKERKGRREHRFFVWDPVRSAFSTT